MKKKHLHIKVKILCMSAISEVISFQLKAKTDNFKYIAKITLIHFWLSFILLDICRWDPGANTKTILYHSRLKKDPKH